MGDYNISLDEKFGQGLAFDVLAEACATALPIRFRSRRRWACGCGCLSAMPDGSS